jgi:DNA-directed RNA polymerase specialized sigma24 family protein
MRKASRLAPAKEWELTPEAFARVLNWLDQDVARAGEKYEEIRATLIGIFVCRGCSMAEDLADETIDRVIRKLDAIKENYLGDPARYFFGVAQMIHLEYLRRRPESVDLPAASGLDYIQQDYDCLDKCLGQLTLENRHLIEIYYQDDGPSKMSNRKALAHSLGISPNVLRVRAHRIREHLRKCVEECRKKKTIR